MDTSVFDFDEEDSEPYLLKKAKLFKRFFNHGGTSLGNQESIGTGFKNAHKTAIKKSSKSKTRRTNPAIEAMGNCSPSSDLIEADDSDNESNQERRKLEMRFGGASCSTNFGDEDHNGKQSKEVVMHGEQLFFLEQWFSLPEFIFRADGIVLKIQGAGAVYAVKWPLHEIESFSSGFDEDKGLAFIELELTEHGVRTFLQAQGQSDKHSPCHTLSSSLSSMKSNWADDIKEITSLSDGYKSIWRPAKLDMGKLFQGNLESILSKRDTATSDDWFDLVFPAKGDQDAVTVTQYDFLLLNPSQFLSDTIIDFYIKYLQSGLAEDEKGRFYFYNSFFFQKLTEADKSTQHRLEKTKASFERVKRWTAKVNIFEKDYLFVPIMQSAHWSLVIVCHPGYLAAGCQEGYNSKAPTILHFDSLEGCHSCVEEPIRNYLIAAWNEKNGHRKTFESLSSLKFEAVKAPQQTNYSDCGLFLLHYTELFIKEVRIKQSIDFATDKWFDPAEASSKRAEIQSLIQSLKAKDSGAKAEKSGCHFTSKVTESPNDSWANERSLSFGGESLKSTNWFGGVQRLSSNERDAVQTKSMPCEDFEHDTSNDSSEELVVQLPNKGFCSTQLDGLEYKAWVTDTGCGVFSLDGQEARTEGESANTYVEGQFSHGEDVLGDFTLEEESLTCNKSPRRVADDCSPSVVEITGMDRSPGILHDDEEYLEEGSLTRNESPRRVADDCSPSVVDITGMDRSPGILHDEAVTSAGSRGGGNSKRGRRRSKRDTCELTPTKRVTRNASKEESEAWALKLR